MEETAKKLIDYYASQEKLDGLLDYVQSKDDETRLYAMARIIEYDAKRNNFGTLLYYCESEALSRELREKAGMAIVGLSTPLNPIPTLLEDLATGRKIPETVKEAAGLRLVDVLSANARRGKFELINAEVGLGFMAGCEKHLPKVREAALNALDALDLAKRHGGSLAEMKRNTVNVEAGGKIIPIVINRNGQRN